MLKAMVIVFLLAIIFVSSLYIFIVHPPETDGQVMLSIEPGQGAGSVARELKREGLVQSSFVTQELIVLLGGSKNIKAGMYLFNEPMDIFQVASRIARGDLGYTFIRITVPEGANSSKIAEIISSKFPNVDASSTEESARLQEGYLFPETYFFAPFVDSPIILKKMRETFDEKTKEYQAAATSSGRRFEDVVKVASLLEKEVQTPVDKKMVADIIWRRLKKDMPLQIDSTLGYVLDKTSAKLTSTDLTTDNSYNSYTRKGLPPTPISNPGLVSIAAALEPTPNPYFFYLSDKDGITHFAKTYEEHLKNKRKYIQ